MGWRFRRTVSLFPGVRLNFSKSGVTTTLGPRGAHITVGGKHTRLTTGIPGTGLSATTLLSSNRPVKSKVNSDAADQPTNLAHRAVGFSVVALVVFAIAQLGHREPAATTSSVVNTPPQPPPAAASLAAMPAPLPAVESEPSAKFFVAVDALNERDLPGGTVVGSLPRGTGVDVFETRDSWARISRKADKARWVSLSRLCATSGCFAPTQHQVASQDMRADRASTFSAQEGTRSLSPARSTPTYGSSCSCTGGGVCVGPRGGVYCITSGGNKRYLRH